MHKQYVAFDVGLQGAMVILQGDKVEKYLFPKIDGDYDIHGMMDLFRKIDPNNSHTVIERVHTLFGMSAKANWSFSRGATILEMLAIFFDIPHSYATPKTWQKVVHEGFERQEDAKSTTLLAIQSLFPDEDLRKSSRAKKPFDGYYDTLGIAYYCRETFGGSD